MKTAQWILMVAALLAAPLTALAGAGKVWSIGGAEALSEGDLDGVSVLSSGEAVLAPSVEKIEGLEANYVWDVAISSEGVLYVGTGSPAAIYATEEGKLKLLHKTSEQHVLSVLPLPDGSVLAATAPRGIVYRVTGDGQVSVFRDLDELYVWDMALGPNGEIYCATGPNGKLLRLQEGEEPKVVFDASEDHLLCIVVDPKTGVIFAGAQSRGVVYSIQPDGKASVLYEADENEVRSLLLAPDGTLYAGTSQADGQPFPMSGPPAGGGEAALIAPGSGSSGGAEALPGKPSSANSLYKIVPGEGAFRLAQFPGALVLSLALAGDDVLVGTGVEARLVGLDPNGVARVVTDFEARHISAMLTDPQDGTVIVGTSNGGGVWRLKGGHRDEGTLTSKVFDAGYLAGWGRIWWKGAQPEGTSTAVSLRTGNSREPDDTWSDWSEPAKTAAGQKVAAPMGRFAQLKITLTTEDQAATPSLLLISTSYRQANRRPVIKNVSVNGTGQAGPSGPNVGPPQQQEAPGGKRTVQWEASDPNGDELRFDLYYRGVDEQEWKELDDDLEAGKTFEWDTLRVPDGHYVLRLVASDRRARAAGEALESEKLTPPFVIDNGRPQLVELKAEAQQDGSYVLTGVAQDGYSRIQSLEASHNSGDWAAVFPDDGIFDAPGERFTFRTQILPQGEHVIVFSATDAAGNTGSGKIVVRVQ